MIATRVEGRFSMIDCKPHYGLIPYVASTFMRSLHRDLNDICPESALARAIQDLPELLASVLTADPVLARMRTHLPLLEEHCVQDNGPGGDLARFPAPWFLTESDLSDPFEHWRDRINRIGGPILLDFVTQSVTQDMVGEVLQTLLTQEEVSRALVSPGKIDAFLKSEWRVDLGFIISDAVDEALSAKNLKATHALVGPLVAQFIARSGLLDLAQGVEEEFVTPAFTDRVEQLRDLAEWGQDFLLNSNNVAIWQVTLTWVRNAALAGRDHDWIINALAGLILMGYRADPAAKRDSWGVDPDLNILTVQEAAAFLGIQRSTLHTHINKRKGTPSAVPVELRKVGRGRGTYVVEVGLFTEWAEKYWRPRKRK
jgi:hypothetical protein